MKLLIFDLLVGNLLFLGPSSFAQGGTDQTQNIRNQYQKAFQEVFNRGEQNPQKIRILQKKHVERAQKQRARVSGYSFLKGTRQSKSFLVNPTAVQIKKAERLNSKIPKEYRKLAAKASKSKKSSRKKKTKKRTPVKKDISNTDQGPELSQEGIPRVVDF